jgi:trehalose 6-phosphate synthase/phosphatase
MSDLVIVSNRGPFSFSDKFLTRAEACLKKGLKPEAPKFGEGGLVNAMSGLLKPGKWNPSWIGASMGDRDIDVTKGYYDGLFGRMSQKKYSPEDFPRIEIEPDRRMHFTYKEYDFYMRFVFFDTRHMHSYYSKFANGFLWPLMHLTRSPLFYKNSSAFPRPQFVSNDFVQYTSSSVTFANTISDEVSRSKEFWKKGEDIVIWNQDYHLMQISEIYKAILLEEGLSEEERQRINIGHFMHTPYFNIHEIQGLIREDKRNRVKTQIYDPFGYSIEAVLQKLTWGMLANDFIGFHTKEYCDNYLEALQEWFPVEIRVSNSFYEVIHQGTVTTIGAFPIGLDVDKILSEVVPEKTLESDFEGENLRERIRRDKKEKRCVFGGLERSDYTKGLIERMDIFFYTVKRMRQEGKDGCYYQVTAPSRSENPEYRNLNHLLGKAIQRRNKELGGKSILHLSKGIHSPQNYRFMKEVDVMLVTPLEDGMNLVAFEYILSQKFRTPEERGFLVLSTSGASRVLKERGFGEGDGIVYVNPMEPENAGEKTAEALNNGMRISERLIEYVEKERRVDRWAEDNIQAILNCRKSP